MVDFSKLNDPNYRDQLKKDRERFEKQLEENTLAIKNCIQALLTDMQKDPEYYTEWDRKFVESMSIQVRDPSDKQLKQLQRLMEKKVNR